MNSILFEIAPGFAVTLHLSLTLADGTEALSTFDEEPLEITIGDGTLQGALELALIGLKQGEEQTLTLDPDQTYGWHQTELIHELPLSDFPADMQPEAGQVIGFNTDTGEELAGMVLAIDNDQVKVDFNHPLAGKELVYKVNILRVTPPQE